MNDPAVVSAVFWLSWIDPVKTWAEAGVVICLAVGVVLSFIASPLTKRVDAAKDLRIAELNNETAQLQKLVTGRQLTAEQSASITGALKNFKGRRIYISAYNGDAEGVRLALQIKKAVENAGIDVSDNEIGRGIVGQGMHGTYDLIVGIDMQALESERPFAEAIAAALEQYAQLKINAINSPAMISPPHPTLGIRVGLRPL